MTTVFHLETGSIADDIVRAMARAIIAPLSAVVWLLSGLVAHWRIVAMIAGMIGAVVVCVAVPALPVGLGIVGLFGWVTYPRTAVRK